MYSVLIVDDEEPVLESYEFMLKSAGDFVLAGKARSGYEALKLIYETEPDLVFMDINIPGVDGLGVLEEVHRKYPDMVCILSTAYERFDLAQRAIPLGVFAYLVKPVSKKTFFLTLDRALEQLNARPPEPGPAGEDNPAAAFLRKIIWMEMSDAIWEQYRARLALPSDKGIVFFIELELPAQIPPGGQDALYKTIAEKLSYKHHCLHDTLLNRALFLISEDISRETLEKHLAAVLRETLSLTTAYQTAACCYGIGGLYRGPELYRSCNEALGEIQAKRNRSDVHQRERLRLIQLRKKIGIAQAEEVKELFTRLWEEIFGAHDFTLAKAKMAGIFMLLLDDTLGSYSGAPETPPPFNPVEEIMAIRDTGDWKAWAETRFETLLRGATLKRSGNFPLPLAKAIAYIHDHYAEGLQLGSAAEAAQVSPAYLSRLFSEHLNTSFIDYLTDLRLAEAEKLLRTSKLNIKEVSFAVGYQDPNYFSKLFKKATGLSPSQYGDRE
ncbi:hypothetical protein FACS189468_4160 [Spirochaetia bacterium]|nr:hypothetical protein FACS189468_4160 [Spirochaetia bacterium]